MALKVQYDQLVCEQRCWNRTASGHFNHSRNPDEKQNLQAGVCLDTKAFSEK